MRFLKLGVYHSGYLRVFYEKRRNLAAEPYSVQHKVLIDDCFGSSDFWTQALSKLNYETTDLIANAEPLQKQWADENNIRFNENDWLFEITAAQIKKIRPEILFVADYSTFTAGFLKNIKRECPSIRLVLGWCGAPYNDSSVFGEWDVVLSCIPELVAEFRNLGHRSFHINHAFAPRILDSLDLIAPPSVDFAFIGSIINHHRFHTERERLLINLVRQINLTIWSSVKAAPADQSRKIYAIRKAQQMIAVARRLQIPESWLAAIPPVRKIKSLPVAANPVDKSLVRRAKSPLFGVEMFQQLRASRVVLNNHIDISERSASNMRLFEATGVGACLLTDWKENLVELFEPDTEVLTYRSADECAEKARYILEHESERRSIAEAGQRRALRAHTFENRAGQIDEIIRNFFALR